MRMKVVTVAQNPEMTPEIRQQKIVSAFGKDAHGQGYGNYPFCQKALRKECCQMFQGPWTYFDQTLRLSTLTEEQINRVIQKAEFDILRGHPPSSIIHEYPEVFVKPLLAAENTLAVEIPTLFTEAELTKPGIAAEKASLTDKMIESFDAPHLKRIERKPGLNNIKQFLKTCRAACCRLGRACCV